MTKQTLKRILCVCLAILTLPGICAYAYNEARLVTVNASELFFDKQTKVTLLSTDDGYYISAAEAGTFAGLPSVTTDGVFSNPYTHIAVNLADIPSVNFEGEKYYSFLEIMNALELFYFCDIPEGILYYNAVRKNIGDFLTVTDELLGRTSEARFSADLLSDSNTLMQVSYYIAWLWKSITSMDPSVLWGNELTSDINSLMAELLSPFDSTGASLLEIASSINKTASKLSRNLMKHEGSYEKFMEFISSGEYYTGSDPFIFGIEGTWTLRNSMEAVIAVNSGSIINPAELLALGARMMSICASDACFVTAAERALNHSHYEFDLYNVIVLDEANELIGLYRAREEENEAAQLAWLAETGVQQIASNAVDYSMKAVDFTSLACVKALKLIMDKSFNVSQKTSAILSMKRLSEIQDIFAQCYDNAIGDQCVNGNTILDAKGAAIMYLKCYWNSAGKMMFDESLKTVISGARDVAKDELLKLLEYNDGCFTVSENSYVIPCDVLKDAVDVAVDGEALDPTYKNYPPTDVGPIIAADSYEELLSSGTAPWRMPAYFSLQSGDIQYIEADAFCLLDMNGDGSQELIVSEIQSPESNQVLEFDGGMASVRDMELSLTYYSIFAMYEGKAVFVGGSTVDKVSFPYIGLKDGRRVYSLGHGTGGRVVHTYFVYEGGTYANMIYFSDYQESAANSKHYEVNINGNKQRMDRAEYLELLDSYSKAQTSTKLELFDNTSENRQQLLQ